MKAAPVVSVVMAVHNREGYVAQAVDSILGQTLGDLELIAVDDGSTDGSPEILADYAARDSRVRVHRQRNAGLAAARNAGIGLARGEFVAMMDDDDVSLPARLEQQVGFLRENPDVTAVSCRCELIDESGAVIKVQRERPAILEAGESLESCVRRGASVNSTAMLRVAAIGAMGGGVYRPFFAVLEDLDLSLRLAEKRRLANLNGAPLYRYRQYSPNKTSSSLFKRDPAASWHYGTAAVLSAWARRNNRRDPVEGARHPRELLPLAAQLPPAMKVRRINECSSHVRRFLPAAPARSSVLEEFLDGMSALAAGREEQRARSRTLRKILFYAVRHGRWRDAGRVARELAFSLRPPEVA